VTGLSNGQIVVLYSPVTSLNGAKLLLSKGPPRKVTIEDMSDALAAPTILTPHALPMFRDLDPGRGTKRKREKDRMDPRKSRRPELPVTGPGRGGRVGASATQHVVQNLVRDTTRDVDVSEYLYFTGDDLTVRSPEKRCSDTQRWLTRIRSGLAVSDHVLICCVLFC
jgi:WD repeat-containing protein 70